nr:orotidylic acid pyrophosphorylase [Podospora anserina]
MSELPQYKKDFLKSAIDGNILKFGSFLLKSGRTSPYFFNAGDFYRADLLNSISTAYALTIDSLPIQYDIIFGPAYKGIPLATAATIKLGQIRPRAKYAVGRVLVRDRKEAKDHGEGGNIVGAPLKGKRVLIVDDVISRCTAKREAIAKIEKEGGIVAGIVVALDRMEKLPAKDGDDSKPGPSALGELKKEYNLPIYAILTLDDIIEGIKGLVGEEDIKRTEEYREKYKATD